MRLTRKISTIIALALALILFVPDSLALITTEKAHADDSPSISDNYIVLKVKKSKTISINGAGKGFTWVSSDKAVAKVTKKVKQDNTAVIKAKGEGIAIITATKGNDIYQCKVVVLKDDDTTQPETIKTSKSFRDITIFEKKGTVTVNRDSKTLSAVKDMKLKNKDYSIIGEKSFLRLCLDDKCYVYFEPDAEFSISKGWFNKIKICLTKGEMVVEVQRKLEDDESINVITPNTNMGIRGTVAAVKVIYDENGSAISSNYVLEGSVELTTKNKQVITLKAGEGRQTVSNVKGKVTSNGIIDASKFEFTGINTETLQGADNSEIVLTKYERVAPAEFDYDITSAVITKTKEEADYEKTVIKEYDANGVLRHKHKTVKKSEGLDDWIYDYYYDENGVLRLEKSDEHGTLSNADDAEMETIHILYEVRKNSKGTLIYEQTHNHKYILTELYDDEGRLVEYIVALREDGTETSHFYYAFTEDGKRVRVD